MEKVNKLKLAGALLGATLITASAAVAVELKGEDVVKKYEKMMTKEEKIAFEKMLKKKQVQEQAKAADAKHAKRKWG